MCHLTLAKQNAIVSDCQLPYFLFTNNACGVRACIERPSLGNIQVTEYPAGNVSERAQIYVDNIIAFLVTKRVEYTIFNLATKSPI